MIDRFKIDSHKLIYHVKKVNDWLDGEKIYPIYIEISPSGICNHRCTYCALDFMGYIPRFLKKDVLKERIIEMGSLGIKSVMFAGEGEPLLHKDISEIISYTRQAGIDVAITTNGVFLRKDLVEEILKDVTWIKVSINGSNKDTYSNIHKTKPEDFDIVLKNLAYAAKIKKEKGYNCTLGAQIILLPENYHEIEDLAKITKDIGMDYLVVKPYSQHPLSNTKKYKDIRYVEYLSSLYNKFINGKEKGKEKDDNFNLMFRINTMKKWDESKDKDNDIRNYKHCYSLPFWCYVDAGGDIWGCSAFLKDNRFLYGNIYENTFKEIWDDSYQKRKLIENEFDTNACRINCRMDEINRYLWELKHPSEHVNFI